MNIFNRQIALLVFIISIPLFAISSSKVSISPEGIAISAPFTPKEGAKNIIQYIPNSNSISTYYNIPAHQNCNIYNFSLDNSGTKLTFCEACESPSHYRLIIIDFKTKKTIISFENGGNIFSFSPKGNAIVFVNRYPGEIDGVSPPPGYQAGVWLYNFNTRTKIKLNIATMDLNWSEHDGNIYSTDNSAIYRYDIKTRINEQVPYCGIYFSADSKYNFSTMDRICRTLDNKEMIGWRQMIKKEGDDPEYVSIVFVCWLNRLNSALFAVGNNKYVIFDTTKGKVIGNFRAGFVGINAEGSKVAVHPLGPDKRPQFDKVEILNLLDLIKK